METLFWKRYWSQLKEKYRYDDSITLIELQEKLDKNESAKLFHAMKYWY